MEINESSRFRLHENGNVTITRFAHRDKEIKDSFRTDYIETKVKAGKTRKSFSINNRTYRKVSSSSVRLWKKKRNKVIFLTLTFPFLIDELKANICFSKFIDNLKHNFGLHSYIAVKELNFQDKIGTVPHFHCIFDIPFIHVSKLNRAWIRTFSELHPGSVNALRLGSPKHGTIVKTPTRLVKYICKYTTKMRGNSYKARCIFISHNITSNPVDIDYYDFLSLIEDFKHYELNYRYCSIVIFKGTTYKFSQFWQLLTEVSQKIAVFNNNSP